MHVFDNWFALDLIRCLRFLRRRRCTIPLRDLLCSRSAPPHWSDQSSDDADLICRLLRRPISGDLLLHCSALFYPTTLNLQHQHTAVATPAFGKGSPKLDCLPRHCSVFSTRRTANTLGNDRLIWHDPTDNKHSSGCRLLIRSNGSRRLLLPLPLSGTDSAASNQTNSLFKVYSMTSPSTSLVLMVVLSSIIHQIFLLDIICWVISMTL